MILMCPKGGQNIGELKIPATYVPSRNLIFLSLASAVAEANHISDIFIGINALDYSGYPDCRADFIASFQKTAALGSKSGREGQSFKIKTPLLRLTKAEIIRKGISLGVPYGLTWSCYDPNGEKPCRECDACILREKGFREAGISDPLLDRVSI